MSNDNSNYDGGYDGDDWNEEAEDGYDDGYEDVGYDDDYRGGEDDHYGNQEGDGYRDEGEGYDGPPNEADPRYLDDRYDGRYQEHVDEGGQAYDNQDPDQGQHDDRYQDQQDDVEQEGDQDQRYSDQDEEQLYVPPQYRGSTDSGDGNGYPQYQDIGAQDQPHQQDQYDEEYQQYPEPEDQDQQCDGDGYQSVGPQVYDDQFPDQGDDDRSIENESGSDRPQGMRSSYAEFGGSTTVIDDSDQYPLSTYRPYHVRQQMYRDREASMRRSRQQRGGRRRTNTEEESKQSSSGSDTQSSLEHRRRES